MVVSRSSHASSALTLSSLGSWCLVLFLGVLPSATVVESAETVLGIHGSGTTNPSKCYWNILDKLEARSRLPLHTTYRAVGSTTGMVEFINDLKQDAPIDFASGDIPITTEDYERLSGANIGVIHLPILLGAVSVFHSVPNTPDLNLTACLLAKIYTREITTWTDPEIADRNPNLSVPDEAKQITVGVRREGSSSTESFVKYLHNACPAVFPQDLVSSLPEWPTEHKRCQGSGGMTECITSVPGTIGYIDSGHGHSAGLEEIDLENLQGTFLNSRVAKERDGINAARSAFPENTYDDFGEVSLVNAPGANTWPIVLMTYIYVRRDLAYMLDPKEQSLLIAFLRSLQDLEYVGECVDKYGFILPNADVQAFAKTGIDLLEQNLLPNATNWTFETDTLPMEGAGDYVISVKRQSIADIERAALMDDVEELKDTVMTLKTMLEGAYDEIDSLTGSDGSVSAQVEKWMTANVASKDSQLTAALVLASLSFAFWVVFGLWNICRKGGAGKPAAGGTANGADDVVISA